MEDALLRFVIRDLLRRRLGIDVRRVHVHADAGAEAGSNFDEQGVIERHQLRHPATTRFVVDIGAGDGEVSSNTLFLLRQGWEGLSVEMDGAEFSRLARICAGLPGMRLARCRVTPHNVTGLLTAMGVPPRPGLLSLDIDGYDHEVLDAVLGAFRPDLVVTEVNEKIPPPVRFHVRYSEGYRWGSDHFYGQSIASTVDLAARHEYVLVGLEYTNAFLAPAESGAPALGVDEAYNQGYLDRPDRLRRLPWNRDMDHLLTLSAEGVVDDLRSRFAHRGGEFSVAAGPDAN